MVLDGLRRSPALLKPSFIRFSAGHRLEGMIFWFPPLIPNSRACWVSISRAGAGSRGLAAFKIRNGTLEPWNPGTLKPWNPGTLEPWNPGTPEPWNPETLEPWNPATVEP